MDIPVEDAENRRKYHVKSVIVWTSGQISEQAKTHLLNLESDHPKFRGLRVWDRDTTIELLEEYYPEYWTLGNERISDYYKAAKTNYQRLEELRTLGCSSERHQLPVFYVSPTFSPINENPVEKKARNKSKYSFADILKSSKNTLLIGGAGAGKTTTLRQLLIKIIEKNEKASQTEPIPVMLSWKRLDPSGDILTAIIHEFSQLSPTGTEAEIRDDLSRGAVILLLDGLDELQTDELIELALKQVDSFAHEFPNVRIIMTSRRHDTLERPDVLSNYRTFRFNQFTSTQMTQFIENWYGKDNNAGQKLIRLINEATMIQSLPATPLTLSLVAVLHENGQEIPANLTEVFGKYIELALGKWDQSKDISLQIEWKKKEFFLRKTSWQMHVELRHSMNEREFVKAIDNLKRERGLEDIETEVFVREIISRSDLLFLNEEGEYEFKHRSFQEYFVGCEINSKSNAREIIVENFLDSWWTFATFFACGLKPESDEYLTDIMNLVGVQSGNHFPFAMNLGLVAQASYLAPVGIKKRAVKLAIAHLIEAWDDLCERIADIEENPFLTQRYLVWIFGLLAQTALSSTSLATIISELADSSVNRKVESLSERDIKKNEWYIFILASVAVGCDDIASFEKLITNGNITDPLFLDFGRHLAEEMQEYTWLSNSEKEQAKQLAKILDKKLDKQKNYLRTASKMRPIPLPPPSMDDRTSEYQYQQPRLL